MPPRRAGWRLLLLGVVLALALAALDRFELLTAIGFQLGRRDVDDAAFRGAVVLGVWLACTASLVPLLPHRHARIRGSAYLWLWFGGAIAAGVYAATGNVFSLHDANLLFGESAYLRDALSFYGPRVLPGLALWSSGVCALAWWERRFVPRVAAGWVWLLPLLAGLLAHQLLVRTFDKVQTFPAPHRVALLLGVAATRPPPFYGPRETPALEPAGPGLADHIVLVMDESVSGDLLGINGGPAGTTPFLAGLGERVVSYGIVPAISNQSSVSNLALLSGLRQDQLPDRALRSLRAANLFSYMQAAGYPAFYLDAQSYGPPTNGLTRFDIDALDGFVQLLSRAEGLPSHQLDFALLDELSQIVESHPRSFSYVLKAGAHIHYEDRYPEAARVFTPTLRRGELERMQLGGADPLRTRNSYLNALRFTVDDFWRALFERFEGSGHSIAVIYTADHGQSLLEPSPRTGEPEPITHNRRVDPAPFQAMVPLFLVGFGEPVISGLAAAALPSLRDRVSQFAVFPTLLELAGYGRSAVQQDFGPGLFDPHAAEAERGFVSGDHFGRREYYWNVYRPRSRP